MWGEDPFPMRFRSLRPGLDASSSKLRLREQFAAAWRRRGDRWICGRYGRLRYWRPCRWCSSPPCRYGWFSGGTCWPRRGSSRDAWKVHEVCWPRFTAISTAAADGILPPIRRNPQELMQLLSWNTPATLNLLYKILAGTREGRETRGRCTVEFRWHLRRGSSASTVQHSPSVIERHVSLLLWAVWGWVYYHRSFFVCCK